MGFLPSLFPSAFPPVGPAGAGTSELWLQFMGLVQGTLGIFYLVHNEVTPLLVRLMAWRMPTPQRVAQPRPGIILRPMAVGYLPGRPARETRVAA